MKISEILLNKFRDCDWIETVHIVHPSKGSEWINLICVYDDVLDFNPREKFPNYPELYFVSRSMLNALTDNKICNLPSLDLNLDVNQELPAPVTHKIINAQFLAKGRFLNESLFFRSYEEAEKAGFNRTCISRCCRGMQKYHKGYTWEYFKPKKVIRENTIE